MVKLTIEPNVTNATGLRESRCRQNGLEQVTRKKRNVKSVDSGSNSLNNHMCFIWMEILKITIGLT
jgi:hypothetical protein